MATNTTTDVFIIGAGSAGCVLANRLSADPTRQVTLLEAGGSDRRLMIRMPSAFYMPVRHRQLNWGFQSEPEPNLNMRRLLCPRGRVLGGSSSINGMVYVRGNRCDYDGWAARGLPEWDYASVLPYFKKAQHFNGLQTAHPYKGHDGPLAITNGQLANPLYNTFLSAAQQAGYAYNEDLNGADQEGFGPLPMTVDKGVRASTAHAYLNPIRHRSNLKVLSHSHVLKLIFEGQTAIGAEFIQRGRKQRLFAGEIIVCAGAIGAPQLLMLSGIGSAEHLKQFDINVVHDAPGVGENLMDHLEVYVQRACLKPISLYKDLTLFGRAKLGVQWLTQRSGLGATNHFEVGGFIKSDPQQPYPDIQFHFLPAAMQYDGSAKANFHGFQAHVGPMLSPSRGKLSLRSNRPQDPPLIRFNYMSSPKDWTVFRAAIRAARDIFSQPAFAEYAGEEIQPGAHAHDDADLDAFIRAHAESAYHPCGTCRMGNDKNAVVDAQGRVHGVQHLRVVDASIFPTIPNGNLNAPTIMVAEKIADQI